jgi:ABC-type Fe3+/spermidine/putrescine transport system ATPase subunit
VLLGGSDIAIPAAPLPPLQDYALFPADIGDNVGFGLSRGARVHK